MLNITEIINIFVADSARILKRGIAVDLSVLSPCFANKRPLTSGKEYTGSHEEGYLFMVRIVVYSLLCLKGRGLR
jgi:hypothetical protein